MVKAGILGGGQLGRMLLQAAANYPVETHVLENDTDCPAAHLCHHFTKGDINDFNTVYAFGKNLDAITIEIEHVNVEALERLEQEGVKVIPRPHVLKMIQNKVLQKNFYRDHDILSSKYIITQSPADIRNNIPMLPAVHKKATGGYDGKGVRIIIDEKQIEEGFEGEAVLEKLVDIKQEISLIAAVSGKGEIKIYPPVEMIFDPVFNLVSYQVTPAQLPEKTIWKAEALVFKTIKALESPGLFAVELFVDRNEQVFVNETAPRVHNSGHQSIEGNYSSQFDMLWRILLDYPLGNPEAVLASAMVNIVGSDGHAGPVYYRGLEDVLTLDNVFVHLYGKKETRPGRKMGHVTVLSNDRTELLHKCKLIKRLLSSESR